MGLKHVLVLPFPAQGHVNPLMHLSHKLVQHGFKVTFVNSDFNHKRVVSAIKDEKGNNLEGSNLELVSIPDGLGPEEDRNESGSLLLAIMRTMPSALENLIRDINSMDGGSNRITSIVCDTYLSWALEVGQKLGIKGAAMIPSSAAIVALVNNFPKLIEEGIMDSDGFPLRKGKYQLSQEMPNVDIDCLPWSCIGDLHVQKITYHYLTKTVKWSSLANWWLSNTTNELEHGALSLFPNILPIGPFLKESTEEIRSLGQFWEEDFSSLNWLNQQPPCSVIYVAFGSITIFDPNQFKELALGLELTNRPFLWVVREDSDNGNGNTNHKYPDEFQGNKGKIVKWAPQQMVLKHPAIACFISHCGWNSTMEGVSNGVPFLCWPYFADQLLDKTYICDVWKVGLGFDEDENGIISRWEIKKKVEELLGDEDIKGKSKKMKDMVMNNIAKDGKSTHNFNKFVEWLND